MPMDISKFVMIDSIFALGPDGELHLLEKTVAFPMRALEVYMNEYCKEISNRFNWTLHLLDGVDAYIEWDMSPSDEFPNDVSENAGMEMVRLKVRSNDEHGFGDIEEYEIEYNLVGAIYDFTETAFAMAAAY